MLYVSDPKALHTILVKEEHHFKEADDFVGYALLIVLRNK